ncbi:MAG: penicillin-binding protein [Clostridium sp.]|nr:penicillin-binding protein [Clostridium sp.]MCM1444723.1 penicillin-binding protein [Candidatus Amulumruptor caecigallinarius]
MKTRDNKTWKSPIKLFIIFLVLFCILLLQFAYLSIFPTIYGTNMKKFATNRNTVTRVLRASRGSIFDAGGNPLALNVTSYTVIAYLPASNRSRVVEDVDKTAEALSPLLNMTVEKLTSLLSQKNLYQVELGPGGRGITELKKQEIEDLNLPGISFVEDQKRYYPNGDFASYIIGYAKKNDDGEIIGELGIESKYNDILKGTDGSLTFQRNNYGYKIPNTKEERVESVDGNNIYLTIDSGVQRFLEDAVKQSDEVYNPEWMILTVMDAKTGKVLGSATTPSYDPNKLNITNYENPLVTYAYEPGSTMKIYSYMCAIDKGTYDGNATYLSGSIVSGKNTVFDWKPSGWGYISYDLGFEYSSNVAASTMIRENIINKTDLKECYTKYGFGQKTGIELSREISGKISFNYELEIFAAAYGQGISTTPIQHLQALTMIANDGKMLKPYIIEKIVDPNTNEITYEGEKTEIGQIIKSSTASKMKELMYNVVNAKNPGTTGRAYRVEGLDVIGKTGTAQIYENGSYSNQYIYSFAGMFPKDNPEIIIYGAVKKPTFGDSTALSVATKDVIKNIAKYYNINSEQTKQTEPLDEYIVENYINKNIDDTVKYLKDKNTNTVVLGDGNRIIKQYPSINQKIVEKDKIMLLTNSDNIKMPNILKWSKKDVITLCDMLGINVEIEGYGYVISQSIEANSSLKKEETLKVVLKDTYSIKEEMPEKTTE